MKQKNDILQELKASGSSLGDLPRTMPYEVPGNYFTQLHDTILPQAKLAENVSNNIVHDIPKGYFDQLPSQILNKVNNEEKRRNTKNIWLGVKWVAAAILLIGLSFGIYDVLYTQGEKYYETELAQVPVSNIDQYIYNNIYDFDVETIENTLVASNDIDVLTEQLPDEDIVNYLNEAGWETENNYN